MTRILGALAAIALALTVLGGSAAAAPIITPVPDGIILTTNDSACGQVTVTAHGFGIAPGTTYQLVADRAVKSVVADSTNTASATFTRAEAGEWGSVAIRTSSGGYLAARSNLASAPAFAGTSWYHVRACD
jgi:hypothetical protein